MPDLAGILPEFAKNREIVRRDLAEKQAQMFEELAERERQAELDRINKIIAEANDVQTVEVAAQPASDLAGFQKALERSGELANKSMPLESRIKNAKDV